MNPDDDGARRRASFVGLGVAVVIVLLTVLVLSWMHGNLKTERCLQERRSDCGESVQFP